jgi:site-specific DNA-adenine methylase
MSKRYGIVYMGSKEKILHLIGYVLDRHFKAKYFIDLFAGGFSVSSYAIQKTKMNIIANDLNPYVIALYNEILEGSYGLEEYKYEWISREKFEDVRDHSNKYPDWYVGYVLNVWSFGCNQKDYLYAKDMEKNKKAMHDAIVFSDVDELYSALKGFIIPQNILELDYKRHKKKRTAVLEYIKRHVGENEEDQRYLHLEHLVQTEHLSAIKNLIPLKKNISLHNKDYKELYNTLPESILSNAVIYCDPPYEDTKQYQVGKTFNYEEFWNWFRTCPYPVYVSSYKAPENIEPINFAYKQQLLDNGHSGDNKPKKIVKENLYWNGKGNPELTMEDILFGI